MRPESRINRILGKLACMWHTTPDLRLGQVLYCLHGSVGDLFNVEDTQWEKNLDECLAKSQEGPEYLVAKVTRRTRAPLTCLEGEDLDDFQPALDDPSDVWDPAERERLDRIMNWWRAGKDVPPVEAKK